MDAYANGYIKLHRKFRYWGWYSDPITKSVFLHLLLICNFRDGAYFGYDLQPGQAVIGLEKTAKELGISVQKLRTALLRLERTGEITRKSTNKFTVVTVENWQLYQLDDSDINNQLTNEQQTDNKQITNEQQHLKKEKKEKKEKKYIKPALGELENVLLTEEELAKLKERFPTEWEDRINSLSEYIGSRGKRYSSHYATILSWARKDANQEKEKEKERKAKEPSRPPYYKSFGPEPKKQSTEMPKEIRDKLNVLTDGWDINKD